MSAKKPKPGHKRTGTNWGKPKGPMVPIYTFNSLSTASSDKRVLANTPSMLLLKAFLARPIP